MSSSFSMEKGGDNMNMICLFFVLTLVGQINCQTTESAVITGTSDAKVVASEATSRSSDTPTADIADTSPGPDKQPSACNTSLSASAESVSNFRSLVDDGAIFIYMKLIFVDAEFDDPVVAYMENIGNVINPLRWVWAKGGRGRLLLSSPFDFNQLSLTTLSTGVFSVHVKIYGCITGESDEDKIEAIVELLQEIARDEVNQTAEDLDGEEMLICLEKQLGKGEFPLPGVFYFPASSYTMMQASTAFDCWPLGTDSDMMERLAPTQYWLGWIFFGGVILALFSPMAMSFFVEKSPPVQDDRGVERLSLVSDLPLGLKYILCFWRNDHKHFCVSSTRWTFFILLFTSMQYIPFLVSFLTDTDDFMMRCAAFYRAGPINVIVSVVSHLLVNGIFVIAAIILLERFLRPSGQLFLEPLLRERDGSSSITVRGGGNGEASTSRGQRGSNGSQDDTRPTAVVVLEGEPRELEEEVSHGDASEDGFTGVTALTGSETVEESNIAYRHIVLVEAPKDLWAPVTPLVSSQAFFYYMGWRAKMGLDTKAWSFVLFGWLWDLISRNVGAPPTNDRKVLCAIIFAILYPLYLPFGLIFFGFNSLPLLYCMTRCLQTAIGNDVKCSELMFAFLISLASIAWFFKFVATFIYIAELLGYSFMGFVVNAEAVGPTVLVVVIFTGYVVGAITKFYDGYCALFKEVMQIAEKTDKETRKKATDQGPGATDSRSRCLSDQARPTGSTGGNDIQMSEMTPQTYVSARVSGQAQSVRDSDCHDHDQASVPTFIPLVTVDANEMPSLELNLFWLIVEKYRPIKVQVASSFFELLVIVVAIGFGMSILFIADSLSELSTTVSLFSSVIIAGVVPTVIIALRSPASLVCYDEAKMRQIEGDIEYFAENEKLKGTAP